MGGRDLDVHGFWLQLIVFWVLCVCASEGIRRECHGNLSYTCTVKPPIKDTPYLKRQYMHKKTL